MNKSLRMAFGIALVIASLVAAHAQCAIDPRSYVTTEDVKKLKKQIEQVQGVSVVASGVEINKALSDIVESILALDFRVTEIEKKDCGIIGPLEPRTNRATPTDKGQIHE